MLELITVKLTLQQVLIEQYPCAKILLRFMTKIIDDFNSSFILEHFLSQKSFFFFFPHVRLICVKNDPGALCLM